MPTYPLLISAAQLQALADQAVPHLIFDCTFDLSQPALGRQRYLEAHLPGAIHADLDAALSAKGHGSAELASGGRHPLPTREAFATWLGCVGLANRVQVVVYDRNNANFCGRLWWMLKWLGHDAVAVLDGGLQGWQAVGGALVGGESAPRPAQVFVPGAPGRRLVDADEVAAGLAGQGQILIDARAPERYRGEVEPLDAVAGHIPGALNRPFASNLDADGHFKPAAQLRAEFEALLAGQAGEVVHHCGSGVSAIPNVLAMELAGLGQSALYAGSWSDWSSVPGRPVARG